MIATADIDAYTSRLITLTQRDGFMAKKEAARLKTSRFHGLVLHVPVPLVCLVLRAKKP